MTKQKIRYEITDKLKLKWWFTQKLNLESKFLSIKYISKITEKAICVCLRENYNYLDDNKHVIPYKFLSSTFKYWCNKSNIPVELGYLWIPKSVIENIDDILVNVIQYSEYSHCWSTGLHKPTPLSKIDTNIRHIL